MKAAYTRKKIYYIYW